MKLHITTIPKVWGQIQECQKWWNKNYKGENVLKKSKDGSYSGDKIRDEYHARLREATKAFHNLRNYNGWGFTWDGEKAIKNVHGGISFTCLDGVKDLKKHLYLGMGLLRKDNSAPLNGFNYIPTAKGKERGIKAVK